jgi:hypothetical protein
MERKIKMSKSNQGTLTSREALAPFVRLARAIPGIFRDDDPLWKYGGAVLTVGHFRDALAAYEAETRAMWEEDAAIERAQRAFDEAKQALDLDEALRGTPDA